MDIIENIFEVRILNALFYLFWFTLKEILGQISSIYYLETYTVVACMES